MMPLDPRTIVVTAAATSVVFVVGLVVLRRIVVALPSDHFVRPDSPRSPLLRIARQIGGVLLVVAGILMLVLPGPGVLGVLLGVALFESPKKAAVLRKLLSLGTVRKAMNELRARAGKEPFVLERESGMQTDAEATRQPREA